VTGGSGNVQPRVVRAGDENKLLGELALPYNANPYLPGFGVPTPVAGAALPTAGDYDIVRPPVPVGLANYQALLADDQPG